MCEGFHTGFRVLRVGGGAGSPKFGLNRIVKGEKTFLGMERKAGIWGEGDKLVFVVGRNPRNSPPPPKPWRVWTPLLLFFLCVLLLLGGRGGFCLDTLE